MITREQANSIIEAMQNDDGDTLKGILSGLIESNQMTKDEANSLIGSMQADDGQAVMDQLKGMIGDEIPRPPIPDVVAPDVLETMKQQALQENDMGGYVALNAFPRVARSAAEGGNILNTGAALTGDILSMPGRGINALLQGNQDYGMMETSPSINMNPNESWHSLGNLGEIAKGVGKSVLTDPTTPLTMGFASLGKAVASKLPMAYQSSRLAKIGTGAVEGAVAGGAQGGTSNLLEQTATPNTPYDVGSLGTAVGFGAGLGGLVGGALGGVGLSKPDYLANQPLAKKTLASYEKNLMPDEYEALATGIQTQKTGLTPEELDFVTPAARPAITNMTEETQRDLKRYYIEEIAKRTGQKDYGEKDIYDKVWTEFVEPMGKALEADRVAQGVEMNRIEGSLGSEPISSAKATDIISTLKKSVREKLGYEIEMKPIQAESGLLDAQGKPTMKTVGFEYDLKPIEGGGVGEGLDKVKAIVADAMNTLTSNPTPQALRNLDLRLGDKLQSAQPELIPIMKKTKGALKDLETAVEKGVLDEVGQKLGSEERELYSQVLKRYGQIRSAEKLLNVKGGRATEFTTSAGEDLFGSTKGASALNAAFNPQDRGVRFIRDVAVKEYGIKDPIEQMALAKYAKEVSGTKAKSADLKPKGMLETAKNIAMGRATDAKEVMSKITSRDFSKTPRQKIGKTESLGKVLSGTGLSDSDKKKLEFTRKVREGFLR